MKTESARDVQKEITRCIPCQVSLSGRLMISLVIPMLNEEDNVEAVFERVTATAAGWGDDYEIIVVDDGSTDRTPQLLTAVCQRDSRWRVVSFSRNFGHQSAVSAGLEFASGEAVAVIDGDLQDPPEVITPMLERWRSGAHVVYGVRKRRKESVLKRAAYHVFYRVLRRIASMEIPLDSGDFCVMDRAVVAVLNSLPEKTRFIRGLRAWAGFRQESFEYERHARQNGSPKYTLARLIHLAGNGMVSFSAVPLRLASGIGVALCGCSIMLATTLAAWWLSSVVVAGIHPSGAVGWTSIVCLILLLAGIQMLMIGIVGEYIARIFDEVKARPAWVIARTVNVEDFGTIPHRRHPETEPGLRTRRQSIVPGRPDHESPSPNLSPAGRGW